MWTHVASELILTGACALPALVAWRQRAHLTALGFASISVAALLGAAVYAGLQDVASAHDTASFLAGRLGLLLIALRRFGSPRQVASTILACAVAFLVPAPVDLAVSMLALVAIVWRSRSPHGLLAMVGGLMFALAGLVVGTQGEWLDVPRVDLFHLSLATAALLWLKAGVAHAKRTPSGALP